MFELMLQHKFITFILNRRLQINIAINNHAFEFK